MYLAEPKAFPLVLVLSCGGAALLVLLFAVILFVRHHRGRYQVEKKRREARKKETDELEMEVQLPENDLTEDPTVNIVFVIYTNAHIDRAATVKTFAKAFADP